MNSPKYLYRCVLPSVKILIWK